MGEARLSDALALWQLQLRNIVLEGTGAYRHSPATPSPSLPCSPSEYATSDAGCAVTRPASYPNLQLVKHFLYQICFQIYELQGCPYLPTPSLWRGI